MCLFLYISGLRTQQLSLCESRRDDAAKVNASLANMMQEQDFCVLHFPFIALHVTDDTTRHMQTMKHVAKIFNAFLFLVHSSLHIGIVVCSRL